MFLSFYGPIVLLVSFKRMLPVSMEGLINMKDYILKGYARGLAGIYLNLEWKLYVFFANSESFIFIDY
jgi:hypothetical protein